MQRGQGPKILKQFFIPFKVSSLPLPYPLHLPTRISTAGLVKSGFSLPDSVAPAHRAEH